ncbi:hypothetical protein [Sanguibacter sp. HDW7]|uniref:hypothetical protein n=1 Tax=Sanguibacter sp. HDW7 TaxID=2714931 RepID=UPI0014084E23|nr:hypothetical protein [Sanguibacter sp. HDW7]QIK83111.1 hypothetical protein G7063_05315 [Sanguibacter sp. HDW7]
MAKKASSEAASAAASLDFELDTGNLREVLDAAKAFSPKLARELRKELRQVGADIIAEQTKILSGPLPGSVAVTGTKTRIVVPKNGRAPYRRTVNVYEERQRTARDRKRGMRKAIAAGLKTRVVTGKTRQGVAVRTTRSASGSAPVQAWQSRRFRHQVFSTGTYVDQLGQPYFWGPAITGRDAAMKKIDAALAAAITEMTKESNG